MPWPAIVPFLARIVVGVAINVIGYMMMPKPKQPKPKATTDWETPTAEAGRPVPVLFGTMTISGLNVLYSGQKEIESREMRRGKK